METHSSTHKATGVCLLLYVHFVQIESVQRGRRGMNSLVRSDYVCMYTSIALFVCACVCVCVGGVPVFQWRTELWWEENDRHSCHIFNKIVIYAHKKQGRYISHGQQWNTAPHSSCSTLPPNLQLFWYYQWCRLTKQQRRISDCQEENSQSYEQIFSP